MTIHKKIYILNAVIWIGALALATAGAWRVITWVMHKWNFPGLP